MKYEIEINEGEAVIAYAVPVEVAGELTQAFASVFNYEETVVDPEDPTKSIPNPIDPVQFAKLKVLEYAKSIIKTHRAQVEAAKQAKVDGEFEVTVL